MESCRAPDTRTSARTMCGQIARTKNAGHGFPPGAVVFIFPVASLRTGGEQVNDCPCSVCESQQPLSTIEFLSFLGPGPGLRSSRLRRGLGRLGCDPLALGRSEAFSPRLAALLANLPHSFPECLSIHGRILTPYQARWRKAVKDVLDTLASKVRLLSQLF